MSKIKWKPGTFLYPIPAVMVSCGTMEKSNIITVAWTGIINTDPAMVYISVRPTRYSYNIIKEQGEFVINLTTEDLARTTDWCGVKTGAKVNKFKEMNLHKEKANIVKCPMIKESPVSVECKVKEIKELGKYKLCDITPFLLNKTLLGLYQKTQIILDLLEMILQEVYKFQRF